MIEDLARIADLGVTGVARDWIRPGLRLHIYGKYCAYFRTDDECLTVLRIVHGARDLDTIIFDPKN
jgi:toxin ParE1/3/4